MDGAPFLTVRPGGHARGVGAADPRPSESAILTDLAGGSPPGRARGSDRFGGDSCSPPGAKRWALRRWWRGGVLAAALERWRGQPAGRGSAMTLNAAARFHPSPAADAKRRRGSRCVSSPWARWAVFLGSQASVAAWHRWPSSQDANAVAR